MSPAPACDVAEIATAIATGTHSAESIVASCLARIAQWQPAINAFVQVDVEVAMSRARAADRARAAGHELGKLHGVPIAIKDMFDRTDLSPGCGAGPARAEPGLLPATVINRLERAGAIIIGALNMTEYALGLTGHNDHLGDACNPWAPAHVTGGSSSGPAIAVAARLVPAAIGSDTGASIRLPAAWCGVAGLKPTHGRVGARGAMPMSFALDTIGPLATTMRGAARVLSVIAGAEPGDATAVTHRVADYEAALTARIDGLRIGVVEAYFGDNLDAGVAAALDEAVRVLRSLGATITSVRLAHADLARRLHRLMMAAEAATIHDQALRATPERFTPEVRYRLELGRRVPATAYLQAARGRGRLLRQFLAEGFDGVDALLTALVPRPAPLRARTRFGMPDFEPALLADIPKRTQPFNYLGLPALAVPCGFVDGLPIGYQLVGKPFDEATLLTIGAAYERATDWHQRIPAPPHGDGRI